MSIKQPLGKMDSDCLLDWGKNIIQNPSSGMAIDYRACDWLTAILRTVMGKVLQHSQWHNDTKKYVCHLWIREKEVLLGFVFKWPICSWNANFVATCQQKCGK